MSVLVENDRLLMSATGSHRISPKGFTTTESVVLCDTPRLHLNSHLHIVVSGYFYCGYA